MGAALRAVSAFAALTLSSSPCGFLLPGSVERLGRAAPPQRLFSALKGRVWVLRCLSRHRARCRYYTPGLGPQERDMQRRLGVRVWFCLDRGPQLLREDPTALTGEYLRG